MLYSNSKIVHFSGHYIKIDMHACIRGQAWENRVNKNFSSSLLVAFFLTIHILFYTFEMYPNDNDRRSKYLACFSFSALNHFDWKLEIENLVVVAGKNN